PVKSPITEGIDDFEVCTEQYYIHVDPAVQVLATTRFPVADGPHVPNGPVDMPVVWTKRYGAGRVFYNSLGHQASIVASEPCLTLMRRGMRWAAK
ncbi:MAG: ThuA domain-containing protein, partial [Phycisphaerae bacterium]|nr:ThuA domain-containing protein [Phycisphaerae bacterium]